MASSIKLQFRPALWILPLWILVAIGHALAAGHGSDHDNHARQDKTL
jgi:hypothetical protein